MVTLHVDDDGAIGATVASLRAGHIVVIPTDTVYGLAALPTDADAVAQIYAVKERPAGMHLPVLGATRAQVRDLGVAETEASKALADRWWPGPLTMVFGFAPDAGRPPWLAGRDEVGVRIPRHTFLLALMEVTGVLVVTSANPHGATTAPTAGEAADELGPRVDVVVDGGHLDASPSTLVTVRAGLVTVERVGALTERAIAETLAAAGTAR